MEASSSTTRMVAGIDSWVIRRNGMIARPSGPNRADATLNGGGQAINLHSLSQQHTGRVRQLERVALLPGHDDDTDALEQAVGVHLAVDVRAVQARKAQIENDGGRRVDFQK